MSRLTWWSSKFFSLASLSSSAWAVLLMASFRASRRSIKSECKRFRRVLMAAAASSFSCCRPLRCLWTRSSTEGGEGHKPPNNHPKIRNQNTFFFNRYVNPRYVSPPPSSPCRPSSSGSSCSCSSSPSTWPPPPPTSAHALRHLGPPPSRSASTGSPSQPRL